MSEHLTRALDALTAHEAHCDKMAMDEHAQRGQRATDAERVRLDSTFGDATRMVRDVIEG